MFSTLLQAELRHWARQPIPYLFATVLFAIAFVVMWGMASEAAGGDNAEVLNSPYRLSFMTNYLSLLLLFLLPSVVGAALHRDYKSRMYTLLYAYPLTKHAYLAAKFGAAMLVVFLVVCTIGLGFALGAQMPGIPPEVIAPFRPAAYAQFYGLFLLPNMVLFGLLVFLVVIRTRNIYLAFIAVILLVAGQAIVSGLLRTADFQTLAALLDPTGDTAVKSVMRQYTLAERNVMLLPVSGVILANRLLWYGVTFILAIYTYRRFSFQQFVHPGSRGSRLELSPIPLGPGGPRPVVQPSRGGALLPLAAHNFRYVTHSYAFAALLLVGLLTVYFQQAQMNPEFGFATLPTTARMLRVPMLIFGLTINLVTFLYVGVLAHRGRMTRMGDLVDVSAVSDRTLLFSRLLAILGVQLLLLFLVMLAGVGVQLSQGYTRTEIGHYVLELFGLQFVHFAIWACLATFVHTLFTNLYVGIFVLILTGAAFSAVAEVGKFINWPFLADGVVQFNTTPRVFGGFAHSDWTGYNGVLPHYLAYKFYWLLAGGLLLTGSLAWWRRGYFFSGRERRSRVWNKGHGPLRPWLLSLGSGFLLLGAGLYYHDHVLAGYTVSDTEYERTLARNETLFTPYLAAAQPSLVRVETEAELFPGERRYQVAGTLWFVNKQERLLDTIVVNTSFKDRVTYTLGAPHLSLLVDSLVHTGAYQLTTPLHPGDSLALDFTARNAPNAPLWTNDRINSNGTYLQGYHMLPRLGVRGVFLTRKRSDYGLPEEIPTAPEADLPRIHYATTVSTD
ncbi:MAG: ABC transporter permease, partial [Bacteroidota bacterium]